MARSAEPRLLRRSSPFAARRASSKAAATRAAVAGPILGRRLREEASALARVAGHSLSVDQLGGDFDGFTSRHSGVEDQRWQLTVGQGAASRSSRSHGPSDLGKSMTRIPRPRRAGQQADPTTQRAQSAVSVSTTSASGERRGISGPGSWSGGSAVSTPLTRSSAQAGSVSARAARNT